MKTVYSVSIQAILPVTASINVLADSEYQAGAIAQRIAESQSPGVKSKAFEIELYPADFLRFDGVTEITPDHQTVRKIWDWEKIEELLGKLTV